MERRGLILDTAHLNETSFFQALEHFRGPVLCSHTGLRRFHDTPRNLSGEQVAALMERGAVVGVTVAPEILAADRSAGLEEAVRSIDWIVQRFGPEGVGLGSDYGGFDTPSRGLEHPGLLDRLGAALDGLGYPEEAVAGIMGGAWLRFFEANWPGA
jgi:membrane dipeptidase